MLDLGNSLFFLPNKRFRELSILLVMHHDSELSQHTIASRTQLSGAMVNGYVKKMRKDGLIDVINKNKRDKVYQLTAIGKETLMEDLIACSTELVQLFSQVKEELKGRLQSSLNINEQQNIVLFGGANTAQLVLSAIENVSNVHIAAIVDNDSEKWGSKLGQFVIQSPSILNEMVFDCVVICSFARQDEIYQSISSLEKKGIKIIRLSSI